MWSFGVALVGSGLAAAALGFFSPKPTFTARTLVHIYSTRPFILKNVPDNQTDFANYQRNLLALLRSRLVLNSALRNPKVASLQMIRDKLDPIAWLEKEIQADFSVAPEILRIALAGEEPKDLVPIVDAVRDAYVKDIVYKEHNQRSNRLSKLKLLSHEYGEQVRKKKEIYDEMSKGLGSKESKSLTLRREFALAQLQSIQNYLLSVQQDLLKARNELEQVMQADARSELPQVIQTKNQASHKQKVSSLENLEKLLLTTLETRIEAMEKFKENRVNVEWLRDEIANAESLLKTIETQISALDIEITHAPERVTLLEEAIATQDPDDRLKQIALAGAGVFVVLFLIVAVIKFRSRVFKPRGSGGQLVTA